MTLPSPTRRRLLSTLAVGVVAGLAGCSGTADSAAAGDDSETDAPTDSDRVTTTPATTSAPKTDDAATTTSTPPTDAAMNESPSSDTASSQPDDALDLREANVVDVALEGSGSYRFDVTLYHDDDGESGYADWWQVETLSGEHLGRRELLHAHSTAPFTRSERISLPEGITYVVVRGHDQTHGYGGQAMVVNVDTGEIEPVRQGPEPRDFSTFEPSV